MAKGCGNCLFQDNKKKVTPQGIEIFCLVHLEDQCHGDTYVCDSYRVYTQMSLSDRARLALEVRNRVETQKRHQDMVGIAKESNKIAASAKLAAWWAIWISIGSIVISVLVAIFKK